MFRNLNGFWSCSDCSGLFVRICVGIFANTFQDFVSFSTRFFCYPGTSSHSFAAAQRKERSFATHWVPLPHCLPCVELGSLATCLAVIWNGGKVVLHLNLWIFHHSSPWAGAPNEHSSRRNTSPPSRSIKTSPLHFWGRWENWKELMKRALESTWIHLIWESSECVLSQLVCHLSVVWRFLRDVIWWGASS